MCNSNVTSVIIYYLQLETLPDHLTTLCDHASSSIAARKPKFQLQLPHCFACKEKHERMHSSVIFQNIISTTLIRDY